MRFQFEFNQQLFGQSSEAFDRELDDGLVQSGVRAFSPAESEQALMHVDLLADELAVWRKLAGLVAALGITETLAIVSRPH